MNQFSFVLTQENCHGLEARQEYTRACAHVCLSLDPHPKGENLLLLQDGSTRVSTVLASCLLGLYSCLVTRIAMEKTRAVGYSTAPEVCIGHMRGDPGTWDAGFGC